jgi:two-component system response regulator AlgR
MKVLIVDDESLARARLKRLLAQHASFTCVGEAGTAREALELSYALLPDIVFLDIEMPDSDGLSVAAQLLELKPPPAVVFVTAHPQHALAAYQVAPADYLLKPVSAERLALTLSRLGAKTRAHIEKKESNWLSYRNGLVTSRVDLSEVIYLQAEDKYVRVVFVGGEALIEQSLKQLEEQYPKDLLRIHRNTLVHVSRVKAIHQTPDGKHLLELNQHHDLLEISRRELAKLRQILL